MLGNFSNINNVPAMLKLEVPEITDRHYIENDRLWNIHR